MGPYENERSFQAYRGQLESAFDKPGHNEYASGIGKALSMREMMDHPEDLIIMDTPGEEGVALIKLSDIPEWELRDRIQNQVRLERSAKSARYLSPADAQVTLDDISDEIGRRVGEERTRRNLPLIDPRNYRR